jgi:diguanylate cyclase (GGDEF)-like protein
MVAQPVILAIDDDPSSLQTLGALLQDRFDVRMTSSGEDALELAPQLRPDLVLLDVMLPGIDGFETCRRLKQVDGMENVPVLFITGLNMPEDEVKCFDAGGADFVSKPFHSTVLRARVTTHVRLKQGFDKIQSLAIRDGLTQLYNRRYFDEALSREWFACKRSQQALSVLLIDVDHFKAFNDSYGHLAGDQCLVAVAKALQSQLRRSRDVVARYGGEEFACILPGTSAADAMLVAEKLRQAVKDLAIPHRASAVGPTVTASIGLACELDFEAHAQADLLAAADQQLYMAKARGRDQVAAGH